MMSYWLPTTDIDHGILIPKYYDPELVSEIEQMSANANLISLEELIAAGELSFSTGDEIGSHTYGTGAIPFVRTSDISNWEIKSSPKLGVSESVYRKFSPKQNVQEGDVLFVRDGTYLIGTNCFVTRYDKRVLFQSHILKFRVKRDARLAPEELFLGLNNPTVQRQIRSRQFTADIIDTLGSRWREILIPIGRRERAQAVSGVRRFLDSRSRARCFIRQIGLLLENVMKSGSSAELQRFDDLDADSMADTLAQDTISMEYGGFEATWIASKQVRHGIYIPKYYDPEIEEELKTLAATCDLLSIKDLESDGLVALSTGDELGKMSYGTGDIPFIRTSDFANWELKHDPKQNISEQIYALYQEKQDVRAYDILLVRDGTYLVGSSTIVLPSDAKMAFCGGLYKLRALQDFEPFLLFGLLNSYIVKRQMRARQFTRDVIDTLGKRISEIIIPVPKSEKVRAEISERIRLLIEERVTARDSIASLARNYFR